MEYNRKKNNIIVIRVREMRDELLKAYEKISLLESNLSRHKILSNSLNTLNNNLIFQIQNNIKPTIFNLNTIDD